ncbi:unnamed protein product [Brachionus calyciflorus]|uniref:F5/8 type C domain-containing protein n=1 Tax=Brachionus calyciflorus TaxID=104777 RepID=A0A813MRR5_9BILA|nr:unnamed protein product [Brachionus calyciflorus]
MSDTPLAELDAIVSIAISNDENHPASNVIDGKDTTMWMTTGLLPQSLTISFPKVVEIKQILITSCKVRNLIIERSIKSHPTDFETCAEKSYKDENKKLQVGQYDLGKGVEARHLKFIISEAYDSFIAVQHIKCVFAKGSR